MTAATQDPPHRHARLPLVVFAGGGCAALIYDEILAYRQLPEQLFAVSDERRNRLWEAQGGMPAESWR